MPRWNNPNCGFQKGHKINLGRKKLPFSEEHKKHLSEGHRGGKNGMWKGGKADYQSIHIWLKKWFGKPDKCENLNCQYKNPKRYDYALIKTKNHDHKRENYIMLCPSCHKLYDMGKLNLKKV